MKKAIKLKIVVNGKVKKEKLICPFCESGQIYPLKKKDTLYCRMCGEEFKK